VADLAVGGQPALLPLHSNHLSILIEVEMLWVDAEIGKLVEVQVLVVVEHWWVS